MMENEFHLPEKFTIRESDQFYNCVLIGNYYHMWAKGQDYDTAAHHHAVNLWKSDEILYFIGQGFWRIASIQDDCADEEAISVDSLEGSSCAGLEDVL